MKKYNRKLTNIMDGNFSKYEEKIFSLHMSYDKFAYKYSHEFEEFSIVARSFPSQSSVGSLVTGDNVSFIDLGNHRGIFNTLKSLPKIMSKLVRVIKESDILLIRFPGNIAIISMFICFLYGKKFHCEVVADPEHYFSKQVNRNKLRPLFKFLHTYTTKLAARYAITTRYVTSDYLQKKYPADNAIGFTDAHLEKKYFGIRKSIEKDNTLKLVTVAMMHNESKGIRDLIEAVILANKDGVKCSLAIIGDGCLKQGYIDYIRSLGVESYFSFPGTLSFDNIVDIYMDSALYICASYQEGMPRALLEAMLVGMPIVSSDCGGIYEILERDVLFNPGDIDAIFDFIKMFYKNTELLNIMAAKNLEKIKTIISASNSCIEKYNYILARE